MTHGPRRAGALISLVSLLIAAFSLSPVAPATSKTSITVIKDIVYALPDGTPLTLDVYRPTEGWGHPSLLVIHGGAWKRGDKSDWQWVARDLARGGFVAFVANYRLAPPRGQATYPTPVDDLKTAWAWMQQNAARYHGSAQDVAVVGSSAGGHLGLLFAADLMDEVDAPDAVVGLSPPTDLPKMWQEGPLKWAVRDHLGCGYGTCPETYDVASPINRIEYGYPPTFLAYSTDELIPLSHGLELRDQLNEAGVPNRFVTVEGTAHALRMAGAVIPKAMRFLRHNI